MYCGWLCPHFSVVETINQLVRKASGKQASGMKKPGPPWHPDGTPAPTDARYWALAVPLALAFAFLWRWRCSATCCPRRRSTAICSA
ncbi:MAG: 4Fe-4S binding protein [Candidatus Competibacteraceae bacterium]